MFISAKKIRFAVATDSVKAYAHCPMKMLYVTMYNVKMTDHSARRKSERHENVRN